MIYHDQMSVEIKQGNKMKHVKYINLPEKCPRESKRLKTKSKFHFPEDTFVHWTFLNKQ